MANQPTAVISMLMAFAVASPLGPDAMAAEHGGTTAPPARPTNPQADAVQGTDIFDFLGRLFPINEPPWPEDGLPIRTDRPQQREAEVSPGPVNSDPVVPSYTWADIERAITKTFGGEPPTPVRITRSETPAKSATSSVGKIEPLPVKQIETPNPITPARTPTPVPTEIPTPSPSDIADTPANSDDSITDFLSRIASVFRSQSAERKPIESQPTAALTTRATAIAPPIAPATATTDDTPIVADKTPPRDQPKAVTITEDPPQVEAVGDSFLAPVGSFLSSLFSNQPEPVRVPMPPDDLPSITLKGVVLPQLIIEAPRVPTVQQAARTASADIPSPRPKETRALLENIELRVGLSGQVGRPAVTPLQNNPNCVSKGPKGAWFCFDSSQWPAEFSPQIEVDAWLYRNGRRIVQYDQGRATRIFTLFPSRNFAAVSAYFERQFGPPTERKIDQMALIGAPAIANPSNRWRSQMAQSRRTVVLEIRKYDNERRMMADRTTGFIRLYEEGTTPIFRYLNEADLILIGIKNQPKARRDKPS